MAENTRKTPKVPTGELSSPLSRGGEVMHALLWEIQAIRDSQAAEKIPDDFPAKTELNAVGHTTLPAVASLTTAILLVIPGIDALTAANIRAALPPLGYTPAPD